MIPYYLFKSNCETWMDHKDVGSNLFELFSIGYIGLT
jgi:hypothetical protein